MQRLAAWRAFPPQSNMAAAGHCQNQRPFCSLGPVQRSTLIPSLPVKFLGLERAIERGKGREPTQTLFHWLLQAHRVGELISRYWFLTAARLLLWPRASGSAPLHLFPVRPYISSTNLWLGSRPAPPARLLFSRFSEQLIPTPHQALAFSPAP